MDDNSVLSGNFVYQILVPSYRTAQCEIQFNFNCILVRFEANILVILRPGTVQTAQIVHQNK